MVVENLNCPTFADVVAKLDYTIEPTKRLKPMKKKDDFDRVAAADDAVANADVIVMTRNW